MSDNLQSTIVAQANGAPSGNDALRFRALTPGGGATASRVAIEPPAARAVIEIEVRPGQEFSFRFDLASARFERIGNDLVVRLPNGGEIVLKDFALYADQGGSSARFYGQGGELLSGVELLARAGQGEDPAATNPAAGNAGEGQQDNEGSSFARSNQINGDAPAPDRDGGIAPEVSLSLGARGSSGDGLGDLKDGGDTSFLGAPVQPIGSIGGAPGSPPTQVVAIVLPSLDSVKTLSGSAIDGYIFNAKLFLDLNGNGVLDSGEPVTTTGPNGEFTFGSAIDSFDNLQLVLVGGIDISTKKPYLGELLAPAGSTVVTPLTTILAELGAAGGDSLDQAKALLSAAFGLGGTPDLTQFDPIAAVFGGNDQGRPVLIAGAEAQNAILFPAVLIEAATGISRTDALGLLLDQLGQRVVAAAQSGTTLDLGDPAVLLSIVDGALAAATGMSGFTANPLMASYSDGIVAIVAAFETEVDELESMADGTDFLERLGKINVVAYNAMVEIMAAAANGQSLDAIIAEYTGGPLNEKIDGAVAGDLDGNNAPTGVLLDPATVDENDATALVGQLFGRDPDLFDTFTFEIVPGGGDDALFRIDGDLLYLNGTALDFEQRSTYTLTIRATDFAGTSGTELVTITVGDVNEALLDLALDGTSVAENSPGAVVGKLLPTDTDLSGNYTFEIVGGAGAGFFVIDGDLLRVGPNGLDFESGATQTVVVRVSDGVSVIERTFVIEVVDANDAPTANGERLFVSSSSLISIPAALLSANDTDPDGNPVSVGSVFGAVNLSALALQNGLVTFLAGVAGQASFQYTVQDQDGAQSAPATVDVAVLGVGGGNDLVNLASAGATSGDIAYIDGGAGNDTLLGAASTDILRGGAGVDSLAGGLGDDVLIMSADGAFGSGAFARDAGAPGKPGSGDTIGVGGFNQSDDRFDGGGGTDALVGGDGNDAIFLDDRVSAGEQTNPRIVSIEIIDAGAGDDIVDLTSDRFAYGDVSLHGGAGNDTLWSSSGDDRLDGGAGNDRLAGGAGRDTLLGGEGSDRFEFQRLGDAGDLIADFESGAGGDVIDIADLLALDTDFADGKVLADYVSLVTVGGDAVLRVDADGGGAGAEWVDVATIQDGAGLTLDSLLADGSLIVKD